MSHALNLHRIRSVSRVLGELRERTIFIGGAALSLYLDPEASEARPTKDVDLLVELLTYAEITRTEEELRDKGFRHVPDASFKYRYEYDGIFVDLMPMDEQVLGFTNRWYQEGFANAQEYAIGEKERIWIFTPAYFLAAKLEAFDKRGKKDFFGSHDLEDIVLLLENRERIWDELEATQGTLQAYLKEHFGELIKDARFKEFVESNVQGADRRVVDEILERSAVFLEQRE